jgi:hypothetical protein
MPTMILIQQLIILAYTGSSLGSAAEDPSLRCWEVGKPSRTGGYYIRAGCAHTYVDSSRKLEVAVTRDSFLSVRSRTGRSKRNWISAKPLRASPPSYLLFSSRADRIAIGNGHGSGQTSRLQLLRLANGRLMEDLSFDTAAVAMYARRYGCSRKGLYVDVSPVGWERNGLTLNLLVQNGVHGGTCRGGRPESVLKLNTATGAMTFASPSEASRLLRRHS